MTHEKNSGTYTIQTRVHLTAAQREQLFALTSKEEFDLPELLSELLASFLAHLPADVTSATEAEQEVAVGDDALVQEIRERRAEIRRLRARASIGGEAMPAWVRDYIADLERELAAREAQRQ
jgi:hypothetical protein